MWPGWCRSAAAPGRAECGVLPRHGCAHLGDALGRVAPQGLQKALRGELELVTSPALMAELEEVLVEKFDFPSVTASGVRQEMQLLAIVQEPLEIPAVVREPDDHEVLAAARSGEVEFIVTCDEDLLTLGSYEGISVLRPREFWESVKDIL